MRSEQGIPSPCSPPFLDLKNIHKEELNLLLLITKKNMNEIGKHYMYCSCLAYLREILFPSTKRALEF